MRRAGTPGSPSGFAGSPGPRGADPTSSFPAFALTPLPRPTGERCLEGAREEVRRGLWQAREAVENLGRPAASLEGKLLRPLAAYLAVPRRERQKLDISFWLGALAVEMVHEASLLHDDILDGATTRRGRPTMAEAQGIGPALARGDHLLTAAYRVAAHARHPQFLEVFIPAVERTVAGEIAQQKAIRRRLTRGEYLEVVRAKSGELFRAAFALAAMARGTPDSEQWGAVGAEMGRLYQMADDLLDLCPHSGSGKPPLQDYRQQKWTWPLDLAPISDFSTPPERLWEILFRRPGLGIPSPLEQAVSTFADEVSQWLTQAGRAGVAVEDLEHLVGEWVEKAREVVSKEVDWLAAARATRLRPASLGGSSLPLPIPPGLQIALSGVGHRSGWRDFFARNARSFRFAAYLFPPGIFERVAGVYTFCRLTDDLVDLAPDADPSYLHTLLDTWLALIRHAYQGSLTGVPLLDEVVGDAGRAGIPFHYLQELVEGVRMDIVPRTYASLTDLRVYSYRVASVVGGWLTELVGVRDPEVLEGAFALGHAMQLTNILRDVGEDLSRSRLYLPLDCLQAYGLDVTDLQAVMAGTRPLPPTYAHLLEELMAQADEDYRKAWRALGSLPRSFRRAVAVASWVYRGIHQEIRRNGYDNLTLRAATTLPRKLLLATGALATLALGRGEWPRTPLHFSRLRDRGSLPAVLPPGAPV